MLNLEAAFPTHNHHNLHPPSTTPSTHTHTALLSEQRMPIIKQSKTKAPGPTWLQSPEKEPTVFEAHQEGLFPRVRKLEIKFLKYLIPCNTLPELPRN